MPRSKGRAGSNPAPGTSTAQTGRREHRPPPADKERCGTPDEGVPHRRTNLGPTGLLGAAVGGGDLVDGVPDPVHPHGVQRAGDPGRGAGRDHDQVALLALVQRQQGLVDQPDHLVGVLDRLGEVGLDAPEQGQLGADGRVRGERQQRDRRAQPGHPAGRVAGLGEGDQELTPSRVPVVTAA